MKEQKGSFTVEISLIMTFLIPLLVCLIYLGFYMHDRAFLQGAALETACTASLNAGEKNQRKQTERKKEEFLSGRLLGTQDVSGTVELGTDSVSVSFSGTFRMPEILGGFFENHVFRIRADVKMDFSNPKKMVNKIHSLSKIWRKGGDES
ncbi:MAG: TadE family protein [Candidatus Limivivens sp.]|nr:TadE family protein [Candidatus Limivivens sp.]